MDAAPVSATAGSSVPSRRLLDTAHPGPLGDWIASGFGSTGEQRRFRSDLVPRRLPAGHHPRSADVGAAPAVRMEKRRCFPYFGGGAPKLLAPGDTERAVF